jgi:hypothetical protein
VEGSHDGYMHLTGAPRHRRRWRFDADGLLVEDWVEGACEPAVARFHLSPGLMLERDSEEGWCIHDGGFTVARIRVVDGTAEHLTTMHAQRFGVLVEASTLAVRLSAGRGAVKFSWAV